MKTAVPVRSLAARVLGLVLACGFLTVPAIPATASFGEPVILAWDHVLNVAPNLSANPPDPAVTVLSPTWFSLSDSGGTVASKADPAYVAEAKSRGVRVEPLFSNGFDPERTRAFLADAGARERSVARILAFCRTLGLDGINIDFENVFGEDRDRLTAYVAELTRALHEDGLRVSMDVTVVSDKPNWSGCYDREALGRIVDAIALMTYDEHWRSSPVSGSVASIGWVEKAVAYLAGKVPPGKIWLGVPFYTREWEETPVAGGGVKVRSRARSMAEAEARLRENGAVVSWDAAAGQYYGEFFKEGKRYRVWLEEERSLGLKLALVQKWGLGGVAAWRRGFEKPQAWEVLQSISRD